MSTTEQPRNQVPPATADAPETASSLLESLSQRSRRHRAVAISFMALGVAALAAVFVLPLFRFAIPGFVLGWWLVAALGVLCIAGLVVSLVAVVRASRPEVAKPLEREQPPPLDFDAPWQAEATE